MDTAEDQYLTIANSTTGLFRDRGSKFYAYAFPILSTEDFRERMEEVKKEHPKARHFCYAYRLGQDKNNFRANDDGEPSGSAGRPILGQLDSNGLTNTFVVVVRYFGGTKLGVPGLINAYKQSTIEALNENTIVKKTKMAKYKTESEYGKMSEVMNAIKKSDFTIEKQSFEINPFILINIREKDHEKNEHLLNAAIAGKIPDAFDSEKDVDGWALEFLGIG